MNDELIMRMWNAEHDRFSCDLGRVLGRMHQAFLRRKSSPKQIDRAYANGPLRKARYTLFGGLAAIATTIGLLALLASLAAPEIALGQTTIELARATQGSPASVTV
jgi:hypothetical protein